MRYRWLAAVLILTLAGITPATANVVVVDFDYETEMSLEPVEVDKLTTLQTTSFPSIATDVSPDDTTILTTMVRPSGVTTVEFVNINDGSTRVVDDRLFDFSQLSEIVWRDARTVVFIATNPATGPVLLEIDRETGVVTPNRLRLPGFPVSLAPNASRLLVAREVTIETLSEAELLQSPFEIVLKRAPDEPGITSKFERDTQAVKLSTEAVEISSFDLNSLEVIPLMTMPEGTGLITQPGWTVDGSKVALVRTTLLGQDRGQTTLSELANQDALCNLPPEQNPFLQGNVVDVFDLARRDLRPAAIKASEGDGHIVRRALWSHDGGTLMLQVQRPARVKGRTYPTYQFPDRSTLRFYDANLQQKGGLDRPELEAPTAVTPRWMSPDEIIFNAVYGLSTRIYYYNHVSGEFRQVSVWDGTSYHVRPTHHSRQTVFNFGSFDHPDELYRINLDGSEPVALSHLNEKAAMVNQIRADMVTFTLRDGTNRIGYLIQAKNASFPPQNAPIVVWQSGGPGGTMTNEWFAFVENPYNLLPNFGIGLLVLPLAGREGFGPAFINSLADGDNFGERDIDDGAEIVQQMIARGWTSQSKVGVSGCSYGGYYAVQSIVRYPDLYGAANSQCTLFDLLSEWQLGFTPPLSYLEGNAPTATPQEYLDDSPLYNATAVRTPLLLFHGDRDFLPVTIVQNFHDQLEANGAQVTFLKFEGQGHGLTSLRTQLIAGQALVTWFRENLR